VGRRLRLRGRGAREFGAHAAERRPPTARPAAAAAASHHVVRRGETLASIARRYQVSARSLASANGMSDPNAIRAGQRLAIPGSPRVDAPGPARAAARTYTVRRGDTMSSIARRHGVSVKDLMAANNLSRAGHIRAGQKLRVPGSDG
jgi:LysM repeat protein